MKKITVINRATGATESWEAKNIKSYCEPQNIERMRREKGHKLFSFVIEFKGLKYDMGMWKADDYDMVVE